jgi:hypothetical protein
VNAEKSSPISTVYALMPKSTGGSPMRMQ